jgi:hypothetical protein
MSRVLDIWLGSEGITSSSISEKKRLYIKESKLEPLTQIEEVEDSKATSDSKDKRKPVRRYIVLISSAPI